MGGGRACDIAVLVYKYFWGGDAVIWVNFARSSVSDPKDEKS